jgi:hypothetical protein
VILMIHFIQWKQLSPEGVVLSMGDDSECVLSALGDSFRSFGKVAALRRLPILRVWNGVSMESLNLSYDS